MNESEFEKELRALSPAAPSASLAARVASEMQKPILPAQPRAGAIPRPAPAAAPWRGLLRILGGSIAVAAAISFLTTRDPQPQPQVVPIVAVSGEPDESTDELISADDEGLVYDAAFGTPQRQLRMLYLERHTWTNPATGAVIEFEVPREDIVLMPVAMQ